MQAFFAQYDLIFYNKRKSLDIAECKDQLFFIIIIAQSLLTIWDSGKFKLTEALKSFLI